MKKILTIVGARPQIIKASAISRAIREHFATELEEVIVHTGQHYDPGMSQVFFDELGIPAPAYNLAVGSASHASQTAQMMTGIEEVLQKEKPNCVLVYGDTNSTLAAAVAAVKLHVPVVHVEAGLRSWNKKMPEEVNRIVCDHASTLLFSPTIQGIENLRREGFSMEETGPYDVDHPGVFHVGDVMFDNSAHFRHMASGREAEALKGIKDYVLVTIHRDNNTDEPLRLQSIFKALVRVTSEHGLTAILPLHPRTARCMETNLSESFRIELASNDRIRLIPPASFLDMISLESGARLIMTDSGGVQKEAYFFQKPCVILRPETEWVELVENGNATITDADEDRIVRAADELLRRRDFTWPPFYGDGNAATEICKTIFQNIP